MAVKPPPGTVLATLSAEPSALPVNLRVPVLPSTVMPLGPFRLSSAWIFVAASAAVASVDVRSTEYVVAVLPAPDVIVSRAPPEPAAGAA